MGYLHQQLIQLSKIGGPQLTEEPREGPMKGGLSVGCRLEILRNVWRRLGNETVSVGQKYSVKCRATLILG